MSFDIDVLLIIILKCYHDFLTICIDLHYIASNNIILLDIHFSSRPS